MKEKENEKEKKKEKENENEKEEKTEITISVQGRKHKKFEAMAKILKTIRYWDTGVRSQKWNYLQSRY